MKLQIMQQGGFMPPYTVYQPVMVNSGTARQRAGSYESSSSGSSSKSSSSSDKDDLTMKDIIQMAEKMDGLPSDLAHITQQLTQLSQIASIPGMANSSTLATYYFTTLAEIKNAKYYKERYDKAFEDINKKQALNEVAISPDGKLMFFDENRQVQYVSVEDYKQNSEDYAGYTPIRNSEILQLRAQANPMDSTYITALSNATSQPEIDKLISQYIGSLGTYETKTSTYEKRKAQTVLNGVAQLQQASQQDDFVSEAGIDGLYNVSHLEKDNITQIRSALKYIYQQLPENAKTLLKYHSDGTDEGAMNIIMSRLTQQHSKTDHKDEILKFDINGKKLGSKSGSGSGSSTEEYADLFTNISTAQGANNTRYTLKDRNGNVYQINGQNYPNLSYDPSHRITGNGSLQFLMDYGYNSVTKGGDYAITFEDQVLNPEDFKDVAFMNDRQATRVILPITRDESSGKIVPDLDFMSKHKELIDLINVKGMDSKEVIQKMKEEGLIDPYSGLPDTSKFEPYLCLNGLSTSKIITTDMAQRISGSEEDTYKDVFLNAVFHKDAESGKDYKYDWDDYSILNPFDWGQNFDRLYKGTIFIPVTQNLAQTKIGAGTNTKVSIQDALQEMYNIGDFRRSTGFTEGSASLLNN